MRQPTLLRTRVEVPSILLLLLRAKCAVQRFHNRTSEVHMPEINTSMYFRDRSAEYRKIANDRYEAGHRESSTMLNEVAAEFEAEADELAGKSVV